MSAMPGVPALFSQEWQVDMPPGQRDEAQSWGSPPDYEDAAPPKILSFADSGSGEGLEVGSLNGPPKRWQENLILSGLSVHRV